MNRRASGTILFRAYQLSRPMTTVIGGGVVVCRPALGPRLCGLAQFVPCRFVLKMTNPPSLRKSAFAKGLRTGHCASGPSGRNRDALSRNWM